MRAVICFLSVSILSFFTIYAQSPKLWTLEECINYAYENNIQLKRQALQTEIAKNNVRQSKIELFPNLGVGINHEFNSGRALNQELYKWEDNSFEQGSLGAQASVTLFDGFRNYNNIKLQQLNLEAGMEQYEKAKNDLALNIAATFLQVLYNKEMLTMAKNSLEVTRLEVERYGKLVEAGSSARGALYEIQAQAALENVNVITAQNNLTLSLLNLAQMLDLDSANNFQVAEPASLNVSESLLAALPENIYSEAISRMPEIKGAEINVQGAEKQLDIAKGAYWPTLTLSGSYYSRYNELGIDPLNPASNYAYSSQLKDNQYKQLGLNLSVPIFTRWANRTRVSNAKISYLDSKYQYSLALQTLYKEIQQAHADALAAYQNFVARTESVTANEESYKYVQQKFEAGMATSVDYNIAKNNYAKATSDLLQAKYQFVFKTRVLDFYRGVPVKL